MAGTMAAPAAAILALLVACAAGFPSGGTLTFTAASGESDDSEMDNMIRGISRNSQSLLLRLENANVSNAIYLCIAALADNSEAIRDKVAEGANPNEDAFGVYPLHVAALVEHIDVIRTLVQLGADVNAVSPIFESTPLHIAAELGNANVVRALIAAGADARATNPTGHTPLYGAVVSNNSEVVPALLAAGSVPEPIKSLRTALVLSAAEGYCEFVRALLAGSAGRLAPGDLAAPLMVAEQNERDCVVRALRGSAGNLVF